MKERLERLEKALDDLLEVCLNRTVLVEGPKDRMAVTLLGVQGEILCVQSDGPLRTAEKLFNEKKEAVILTDWDKKGESIAKELENALSSLCVKYDDTVRSKIRSVCAGEIKDVQSLPSFYCRLVTESLRMEKI
ncbi:MAG: toprim domain-containing protein [Methanomassiliicoccaceae archaeon]|nr:toprim domain-containing protein [Methanomassiliicoccaceae archaeon]